MKRTLSLLLSLIMLLGIFIPSAFAEEGAEPPEPAEAAEPPGPPAEPPTQEEPSQPAELDEAPEADEENSAKPIVILYTNDVHCGMDRQVWDNKVTNMGYPGLAAYKKEMEQQYGPERVTLLDAGDAVQGEAIGTLSNGAYPVDMMNAVGYDYAVPGNHEFDYGMDTFMALTQQAKHEYICCNFLDKDGHTVFKPYAMAEYNGVKVAYVGIATPETFTKSTPAYFQDENGNYIYSFREGEGQLFSAVQSAVDSARAEGAQYVVALAHLGQDGSTAAWRSDTVIANTTGIDILLDGHSHEQYVKQTVNKEGKNVLTLQTGTKLAAIGKVTLNPDTGEARGELITGYEGTDSEVQQRLDYLNAELADILQKEVANTSVALTTLDTATGIRAIRNAETNLGDLCADAYRIMLGADVGFINGGGIRADIDAGPITCKEIIDVHPYGNQLCLVRVTGRQLLDALELGARLYPEESGGFLQVSGLSYSIDPDIPSSVVLSDKGEFQGVEGKYRVHSVTVGGQPLELEKSYTLASHDYMLKQGGDGFTMFKSAEIIGDELMLDNQALIRYITEKLGGEVGSEYSAPKGQGRISARAAQPEPKPDPEPEPEPEPPQRYTVRRGDSLWIIAHRELGAGRLWIEIYRLNKDSIRNPHLIFPGQSLILPAS